VSVSYSRPAQAIPSEGVTLVLDLTGQTFTKAPQVIVTCPDCKGRRYVFAVPHSAHYRGSQLVDCIGRPCVRDADGWFQVAGGAA